MAAPPTTHRVTLTMPAYICARCSKGMMLHQNATKVSKPAQVLNLSPFWPATCSQWMARSGSYLDKCCSKVVTFFGHGCYSNWVSQPPDAPMPCPLPALTPCHRQPSFGESWCHCGPHLLSPIRTEWSVCFSNAWTTRSSDKYVSMCVLRHIQVQ